MSTAKATDSSPNPALQSKQVFGLAAVCLVVGFVVGYVFLGKTATPTLVQSANVANRAPAATAGSHPTITIEQMKQMADVQAATLIERSKADPKNAQLLVQIAGIYQSTRQFKEAADYFDRALKIEPKDTASRTQMASCLFYAGDADGALVQLNQVLKTSPNDVNALFNL